MFIGKYFDTDHEISGISTVYVDATNTPSWEFPMHIHKNEVELSLIEAGEADVYCSGRMYHVREKDIVIKNSGVIHCEKSLPQAPVKQFCLSVSGIHCLRKGKDTLISEYLPPVIHLGENYPLIREMMSYIFRNNNAHTSDALVRSMIDQMLVLLLEEIALLDLYANPAEKLPTTICGVIDYLDEHYAEKISLEMLSERFFISSYYLSRKFKEFTGYSINQYIINRRMGEAERLLIFDNLPIKLIAEKCGYTDLQYFYKTFKKYTGLTPLDFQKQYV